MVSLPTTASIGDAGGDVAEQRQFERAAAEAGRDQLDRAAAVPRPLDEAFFLEVGQVLVHRRQRREPEAPADFLEAGRVAVLLDEIVEVIEDFALTLGQWQHGARTIRKGKAKVNRSRRFTPLCRRRSNPSDVVDSFVPWRAIGVHRLQRDWPC